MRPRTRFAPSPTGFLHIGGVRTALFNWLFTRRHGGAYILRIDDTDQQRNVDAALAPILRGFRWLGLDWDEGPDVGGPHEPYFQSRRGARYQAAVDRLLASGHAYRDHAREEEMARERDEATREKRPFRYSYGIDVWNQLSRARVFVHIVNSELWRDITGEAPPVTPVTARSYSNAGLPWFDLYDESAVTIAPTGALAGVKSVKEIDATKSTLPLQDDEPVAVPAVKKLFWKHQVAVDDG